MSNAIPFPVPYEEHYTIKYDPASHKVDIDEIPDNHIDGACILAVLIDALIEEGTMTEDQVLQTVLQATGEI